MKPIPDEDYTMRRFAATSGCTREATSEATRGETTRVVSNFGDFAVYAATWGAVTHATAIVSSTDVATVIAIRDAGSR
jgi:hypothetical protein